MKLRILHISLLCCLLGCICGGLRAQTRGTNVSLSPDDHCIDSIMDYVIFYAPYYERIISEYKAEEYLKLNLNIVRKNMFLRYLPALFQPRKGIREYILETSSETHFTSPNIYDQRIVAVIGTTPRLKGASAGVLRYFNVNIYAQSLLGNKLLSPFSKNAKKHYRYKLERIDRGVGDYLEYTIKYWPKTKSNQTVSGYFVVSDMVWSIREFEFAGQSEYFVFRNVSRMGEVGHQNEFLPLSYDAHTTFRFLGNKIKSVFNVKLSYEDIRVDKLSKRIRQKNKYDMTDSFSLQTNDTIRKVEKNFVPYRKVPLSLKEQGLYEEFDIKQKADSISILTKKKKTKTAVFWGAVGDVLISNHTVRLDDIGSVKFSPLINPFLLSYSGRDGISYKYKIKYNQLFRGDRLLSIVPTFGYRFKKSEFYWDGTMKYQYLPKKRGNIELKVGNGNRIYSSEVLDDLKGKNDTIDFSKLNLNYFKSLHLSVMHSIELINGLELAVGISSQKRHAMRTNYQDSLGLDHDFSGRYLSVAPRARLSYTPGMYYYMDGKRKIYLQSKYPTFTVDWERGIKGLFSSTGQHERVEFDIQHKIPLGLMRNFYYRLGGGLFTNQEQMYFVDFVYFARRNLPVGWNDDIGGTFQLLDERWYNASHYYGRANIVYETPFLLLPHLRGATRWILKERIYINALMMNQLKPYVELGYGIGTHIFDLGLFVSTANFNTTKFGFKITFELFNR